MRITLLFLLLFFQLPLWAQVDKTSDEVFQIVEEMPRFPGCEDQSLEKPALKSCAQAKMLEFIYQNVKYPEAALKDSIQGTAVVRFVVTEEGKIDQATIVKEIGGGCGAEALRVIELMNEMPQRWIPGKQSGKAVKVYFNLPVKYRIEKEAAPVPTDYFILGTDTVYTVVDELPLYGTNPDEFTHYLAETLQYPAGVDSCVAGAMVIQLFVGANGAVYINEVFDYCQLGFDYQFEAIKILNATSGKWTPAIRDGKPVITYVPVRVVFKPKGEACRQTAEDYEAAYSQAVEGENLYGEGKVEEAITKWSAAIDIMPNNAEFLLLRGQAFLDISQKESACVDLKKAQQAVPLADWLEQTLPMLCVE